MNSPEVASPVTQASLPKSGNLSIKVSNIPSKDMVKVLTDNLPGVTSGDPAMAQANAMAMVVALQAVFQSSGAKVEIAPSQLLSQLVEIKADGAFDVQPQAAFGIVGGLNVAIRGIDDLLALAQKTPEDYDAQQAMQLDPDAANLFGARARRRRQAGRQVQDRSQRGRPDDGQRQADVISRM